MTAQTEAGLPVAARGPAVVRVLTHLSRDHALVVLCDEHENIEWVSDRLGLLEGEAGTQVGRPLHEVLPARSAEASEFDIRSFPVRSFPGSHVVVARLAEDVRRDAERMQTSAAFLSSILDHAPDPVIAADRGGFVTFANLAAAELLAQPVDALVGRPILSCIPATRALAEILDGLRERDLSGHDLELAGLDGKRWVSVSSRRLRLPTGDVVGNVVFLRDISEQRRAELALEAKNEELESYVRNISHDLRSPLGSMLGFAGLLRREYEALLDDEGRGFLDRIEQAGNTMESLIESLLELSRIGRVDDPDTLVDPVRVIRQVIADLKARVDELDVHIEVPGQPPMLLCNRTRVYQIFANLIGNALAHMGPLGREEEPRIVVSIETEPGRHHIRVADNGRGVPAEDHERIFQLFQTLGPRFDGRKPSGVGLAIVRKIAVQHGGHAWVESPPGGGAVFHVTLRSS
jgi:PAS domain S-box-containing protein